MLPVPYNTAILHVLTFGPADIVTIRNRIYRLTKQSLLGPVANKALYRLMDTGLISRVSAKPLPGFNVTYYTVYALTQKGDAVAKANKEFALKLFVAELPPLPEPSKKKKGRLVALRRAAPDREVYHATGKPKEEVIEVLSAWWKHVERELKERDVKSAFGAKLLLDAMESLGEDAVISMNALFRETENIPLARQLWVKFKLPTVGAGAYPRVKKKELL